MSDITVYNALMKSIYNIYYGFQLLFDHRVYYSKENKNRVGRIQNRFLADFTGQHLLKIQHPSIDYSRVTIASFYSFTTRFVSNLIKAGKDRFSKTFRRDQVLEFIVMLLIPGASLNLSRRVNYLSNNSDPDVILCYYIA